MKPNAIKKTDFQAMDAKESNDSLKLRKADHSLSFEEFTSPEPMNRKEAQPPAYIWDRIASVLDEQDRMKALAEDKHSSATPNKGEKKKFFFYAAVAMFLGGVVCA